MRSLLPHPAMKAFAADKRGTVTILSAALIAGLIGILSLVAEYGLNLERQNQDQRIADAAAYAAATYYGANSGASNVLTIATSIAKNVAALNGVVSTCTGSSTTPPCVTATVVTSPASSSQNALRVDVRTTGTLFLSQVVGSTSSLTTHASSYAQFGGSVSACITSLSTSAGINLTGGTSISAPQCSIATNATLSVPCGTTITAKGVSYGGAAPSQGCSGITTPTLVHATVTDPLASNSGVIAAEAHVTTVAALTAPAAPSTQTLGTGGTSVSFNLQYYPTTTQTSGGCSASFSSNVWTITCPAGATYNFTSLTIASSLSVTIATSGSGATTFNFPNAVTMSGTWNLVAANYNFSSGLTMASSTTTFQGAGNISVNGGLTINGSATALFQGAGNVYVAGGFNNSGGAVTFQGAGNYTFVNGLTQNSSNALTFQGSGTYAIGPNSSCSGSNYSICVTNSGVLSFTGTDTFSVSNGIYVNGGDTISMGGGTNNSFNIGKAGNGNAFYIGGGAKVTLAGATGTSSIFQIVGNINADPGGGSCLALGAATNHDINGWFSTAGGTVLGAGTYTLNGYLAFGNNGGGSVTCNGTSVGMSGTGVTIIYSASTTPSGGTCSGKALCFGAGFSSVNLSAPSSGTYSFLLFVGPQSNNTAGALMSGGAGASMSGAFYLPLGAFTMSGGAYINTLTGGCLQIVANSVSMSGGTTAASTCISSGSTSTTPKLVM